MHVAIWALVILAFVRDSDDDYPETLPAGAISAKGVPARLWVVIVWLAASDLSEKCKHLKLSYDRLESGVSSGPPKNGLPVGPWIQRMWIDSLEVLNAYSSITHIIWPTPSNWRDDFQKEVTTTRGKALRSSLGIGSDAPVISRAVRNAFEHTDERMDDWALSQHWPNSIPATMPIAWSISGTDLALEPEGHAHRAYRYLNVRTLDVRIGDEWVSLYEINRFANLVLARIPKQLQVQWDAAELVQGPFVPKENIPVDQELGTSLLAFAFGLYRQGPANRPSDSPPKSLT